MKKNIPIRYIVDGKTIEDTQIEQIAKELWKGKEARHDKWKKQHNEEISSEINLNALKTHDNSETIRTYDTDTKTLALLILSIVLCAFIAGWFMRDHWLQDWIDNIKELRKDNVISQRVIDRETISIQKRNGEIEKTKEKIQKDYNIIIN